MFYPSYTETRTFLPAALSTFATLATYSLRIPQARRRLEAVFIELIYTQTALTTPTMDANWNLIKEVRLKVNDVGQRMAVQASGPQLLLWALDQTGRMSRQNLFSRLLSAAVTNRIVVPVYLRHPGISEPVGNVLGLPLNQVGEDPVLEVDIDNTGIAASGQPTAGVLLRAVLVYRDTDANLAYIPTELVNSSWTLPGTGLQSFDLPNSGFISSVTLDTFSAYPGTRAALYTANDHEYQVNVGSIARKRFYPETLAAINDMQVGVANFDAAGAVGPLQVASNAITGPLQFHSSIDFLFDETGEDAFSPASLVNANTVQLNGDRVRLAGTNFSATGVVRVLTHKFLTRDYNDLKALISA